MAAIVVRMETLRKNYGSVVALGGISLEVEAGTIFGLLGPNGAGKTTTVKILTTLARPDHGRVEIAGHDVLTHPAKVRSLISYVPQELTTDSYLTAREHLRYYADLYHLSAALRESRVREALALVGLTAAAHRQARTFSGGMKKKLDLACGLLHEPALLFLDEPSLGLDVQSRRDVWHHISSLKERGMTIFLCTNYMDEAERLCDVVAIIDRGRIAAIGSPTALRSQLKRDVISVQLSSSDHHGEKLKALEDALLRLGIVQDLHREGPQLKVYVQSNEVALPMILQSAATLSIPIHTITYSRPGLDEVFLHYTGHTLAEGRTE